MGAPKFRWREGVSSQFEMEGGWGTQVEGGWGTRWREGGEGGLVELMGTPPVPVF